VKGHIRERSPGHWAIILDTRDPQTGRRKRKWHSFAGGKREAQIECSRLIAEIAGGTYIDPTRLTLSAFLDRWLDHMRGQITPKSHERYTEIVRKNIIPLLGGLMLTKLQAAHISEAHAKALTSGRRKGTGGLSARTVMYMHRVLRQALHQAVKWQLLVRNPADLVDPPKVERRQMAVYDADATAGLIEAARPSSMFVPVLLGVLCGLRRGEITAMRWRSVDLDTGQLSVMASTEQTKAGCREKETKSGRSRTVAMPTLLVEELRSHRVQQAQDLLQLGIRLSGENYVVAQADGSPYQPRSLTHAFKLLLQDQGLKQIRLHDLRHTHATQMLKSGVHPKIAQERLGHSSIAITLDLYSHVLPGMQDEAAARVDLAVRDAITRHRNAKG
jgi:integrase